MQLVGATGRGAVGDATGWGYQVGMLVDWCAQVLSEGTRAKGAQGTLAANVSETSVHSLNIYLAHQIQSLG